VRKDGRGIAASAQHVHGKKNVSDDDSLGGWFSRFVERFHDININTPLLEIDLSLEEKQSD